MAEKEEWERMGREYKEDREKEYKDLFKWNRRTGCWVSLYFIISILIDTSFVIVHVVTFLAGLLYLKIKN